MREQLCEALRSRWYLGREEIDAILADREYFQPYLRKALAHRAAIHDVPERPVDATDCQAVFLLTEMGDSGFIPDLLSCLTMSDEDLRLVYGDSLTEHMWLPIAKSGYGFLEELQEFARDANVDETVRGSIVQGVAAMPYFHPDRRADAIAFIERLLDQPGDIPIDHLAGILCDCADCGLMELKSRGEAFAASMAYADSVFGVMASADDVLDAFHKGRRSDFLSGRAHDVYGVNDQWKRWALSAENREMQTIPKWYADNEELLSSVEKAALSRFDGTDAQPTSEVLRAQYELANRLSKVITSGERLEELDLRGEGDIGAWLVELPFALAHTGMVEEALDLGRVWGAVAERENFLGDRAMILAEAGRREEALQQIGEVLDAFPTDAWVRIKSGDALNKLGDLERAEQMYRLALDLSESEYDRDGVFERLLPMLKELGRGDEAEALEAEPFGPRVVDGEFMPPESAPPSKPEFPRVGRNEPCPCGSGKKYKRCHGK